MSLEQPAGAPPPEPSARRPVERVQTLRPDGYGLIGLLVIILLVVLILYFARRA